MTAPPPAFHDAEDHRVLAGLEHCRAARTRGKRFRGSVLEVPLRKDAWQQANQREDGRKYAAPNTVFQRERPP